MRRYACCGVDLNIAAKIVGFLGLLVSVAFITFLLNDRRFNDFRVSRSMVNVFGLDWFNLHETASSEPENDLLGHTTTITVIAYSALLLIANLMLLVSVVLELSVLSFPWLCVEFVNCAGKIVGLVIHVTSAGELNKVFVAGSTVYVAVTSWWWLVVYMAQSAWWTRRNGTQKFERSVSSGKPGDDVSLNGTYVVNESPLPPHIPTSASPEFN